MKIALASDHGRFELKEKVKSYLQTNGHEVIDLGCNSDDSTDTLNTARLAVKWSCGEMLREASLFVGQYRNINSCK